MINSFEGKAHRLHQKFIGDRWPLYGGEDSKFLALALAGEVGELANFIKKGWRGDELNVEGIKKELADIFIYLHLLANCFNVDLKGVALDKLEEVEKRFK